MQGNKKNISRKSKTPKLLSAISAPVKTHLSSIPWFPEKLPSTSYTNLQRNKKDGAAGAPAPPRVVPGEIAYWGQFRLLRGKKRLVMEGGKRAGGFPADVGREDGVRAQGTPPQPPALPPPPTASVAADLHLLLLLLC